jgi:hypothetical protein
MPLLSWQLWLARESIKDCPLPWQKLSQHLSPGRVASSCSRSFSQDWNTGDYSQTRAESLLVGLQVDPASNGLVIPLPKKALLSPRKYLKILLNASYFI